MKIQSDLNSAVSSDLLQRSEFTFATAQPPRVAARAGRLTGQLGLTCLAAAVAMLGGTAGAQRQPDINPGSERSLAPAMQETSLLGQDNGVSGAEELTAAAPPGLADLPSRSFGIVEGHGLWAIGPDFKACFRAGSVEFTPALGPRVEANQPLALEFESLRRGEVELATGGAAVPRRADPLVTYDRGFAQECYESRMEGVELFFEIPSRPAGTGPLVARLALQTELPYQGQGADGSLNFELHGLGGVRIGAVSGIDARGWEVAGNLQFDGETLELSIPANFVDSAVYPIVLDPLIGSTIVASPSYQDAADPDVAYDVTTGRYLVAWDRQYSNFDLEIYGALISSSGSVVVPALLIANDPSATQINPSLGNCNVSNRFLCAFQQRSSSSEPWSIAATAVSATDGSINLGAAPLLSTGASDQINPDVGGEATTVDNDVMVVWQSVGEGILARQVTVPVGTGLPYTIGGELVLAPSSQASKPAISKSGGSDGNLLVVWQRFFSGSPGDHDLHGRVIDRNGNFVAPTSSSVFTLLQTIGPDEEDPDCDGANGRWLVAYESQETPGDGDNDILCMRVDLAGTTLEVSHVGTMIEGDLNDDEQDPAVGFTGESHVVAWIDEAGADYNLGVRAIDPGCCLACEGEEIPVTSSNNDIRVEIATQFSGGGAGRQAMFVWESTNLGTGASEILAYRYDALDCPIGFEYCAVNVNSTGGAALMNALGSNVIATNNFVIQASPVPNTAGVFFYGHNPTQVPFGNGFRCAAGGIIRISRPTVASWNLASYQYDLTSHGLVPGDTVNFQYWFRDPPAGGAQFNTSNGFRVTFE